MISVDEAFAILCAQPKRLESDWTPLLSALGRTLASDIVATRAQPPFAASAMDGFAVRSANTPGVLRFVGEIRAGQTPPRALGAGETMRIFTGAALPEGADAILIQENAKRDGDAITAPRVESGIHVRRAGIDFNVGDVLLKAGRDLDAAALTVAATAGLAHVEVVRRPRVSIFSGGDEIVPLGAVAGPMQIYDSISYGLSGYISAWGGAPRTSEPLKDSTELIQSQVEAALGRSDLVVIVGGASVGEYDLARPALAALGAEEIFAKIAVRPGKPTWLARAGKTLVLGLPGNPVSALVCARLFVKPMLDVMLGRDPALSRATQTARLTAPVPANGPREHYMRARTEIDATGQLRVTALSDQDSSLTTALAAANALLVRRVRGEALEAGALVPILPL